MNDLFSNPAVALLLWIQSLMARNEGGDEVVCQIRRAGAAMSPPPPSLPFPAFVSDF